MSRLPQVRYDDLSPEGRRVWDGVVGTRAGDLVDEHGSLIGPFNAFVTAPETGKLLSSLGRQLRFGTSIERRLSEIAIITVGARWRAEFEWWAHARMAREHGVAGDVIDAISRGEEPPFGPDAGDEAVVYTAAQQLATAGQISPDAYAAAQQLLGDAGMVELVSLCGYYSLISFVLNAFSVPLPPGATPVFGGQADGTPGATTTAPAAG